MSQSLQDILGARTPNEPPEIAIIKQFIRDEFKAECNVIVKPQAIIIQVRSSSLGGALRPHLRDIKDACQTDKRVTIRIN